MKLFHYSSMVNGYNTVDIGLDLSIFYPESTVIKDHT